MMLFSTAVNFAHRYDNRSLCDVLLPAYNGLQPINDLGNNHYRVNTAPWRRTMRGAALHFYGEPVAGSHRGATAYLTWPAGV